MGFGHAKHSEGFVHGFDLTDYLRSMGVPRSAETAETSTFRKTAKTYIAGLKDGSITGEGLFDGGASKEDAKLASILGVNDRILSYWPQGSALGAAGIAMLADEVAHEITSDIGDAVGFTFEAQADRGVERVKSLLGVSTVISATGSQSILDNLVATASGGSAYLHSLSRAPGTTADITLRHSSDNFVANNDLLATFTQVSASGVAERVAIVGTIKRYVRAVVTLGSGGTWTFSVALHRV